MKPLQRRIFIKKLAAFTAGMLFLPDLLYGNFSNSKYALPSDNPCLPTPPTPDFGIIDLHCHVSMKMYLLGKKLWKKHHPGTGTNTLRMQVDTDRLKAGYVKGLLATHYLPEIGVERYSDTLRFFYPFLKVILPSLTSKLENDDFSNFDQINDIIDLCELQIRTAVSKGSNIVIARNYKEFESAISKGEIPFAHAIEGAHALGRDLHISKKKFHKHVDHKMISPSARTGKEQAEKYIQNLKALKGRGVCLMSLTHFFVNKLVILPTEGISPDEKNKQHMHFHNSPSDAQPLTPVGEEIVKAMLDIGMIVDLTHSPAPVRESVFRINNARTKPRPIVFTHEGAQHLFDTHNGKYDDYKYYDISDDEIMQISLCGGTIGVIPEVYWLTGCDTHLKECNKKDFRDTVEYMVKTMIYINSKTKDKDFDNISIGSDFDGLADAPRDLNNPSQFGTLICEMLKQGITPAHIKKITNINALRVLKEGWTEESVSL